MKIKPLILFLSLTVLSSLLVIGCQPAQTTSSNQLTVSAAGSLQDVMKAIKPLYKEEYPNREIVYNFASSGALQRQIEQGAPVDVFISAAVDKMDTLEQQNLILTETRRDILKNQIVLVTQKGNKNNLSLTGFKDLTANAVSLIAMGEPDSVPAGKYAQEVLNSLSITDEINAKFVYGKDVRQVLNYVETDNVEVGIFYRTDALVSDQVEIIATAPEKSHSPIIYPIAMIKDSEKVELGKEFIDFLTTQEAKTVFEEYGFIPITND
ncbi:MAG: molybdate ABC transporter substrate-binding protein [Halothece sp.]